MEQRLGPGPESQLPYHLRRGTGTSHSGRALFAGDRHPLGMITIPSLPPQTPRQGALRVAIALILKLGPFIFLRGVLICAASASRLAVGQAPSPAPWGSARTAPRLSLATHPFFLRAGHGEPAACSTVSSSCEPVRPRGGDRSQPRQPRGGLLGLLQVPGQSCMRSKGRGNIPRADVSPPLREAAGASAMG